MNAETRNVNELFSGTKTYRVRLYQRHYIWDKHDWKNLWSTIRAKADVKLEDENSAKKHSTGIVIVQPDGDNLELLDGQQRLITLQIIFCAIRDIWTVFDNTDAAERVQRLIENEGFGESEPTKRYKLLPREGSDRESFLAIVEKKMVINAANPFRRDSTVERRRRRRKAEEISDEGGERIQEAYWHFRLAIAKYAATDYDKLNNLYRSVIEDFTVDQIEVASGDEGARIFGLIRGDNTLDAFNLLSTNLFLRAGTGKVRDKLYRTHWHPFEEYPHSEYRLSRKDKVSVFLAHFLKAKGKIRNAAILEPTPRRLDNRLYDAYQIYRRELSEEMNLDESNLQFVEHELQELDRYAQVYQEIHDSDSEIGGQLGIYDNGHRTGGLRYVSSRFINELRQFILYIKNELGVSDSLLTSVFDFIEFLIVQFVICTGEEVDSTFDLEADELTVVDKFIRAMLGEGDPSIFSHLENYLLSNVLDINMRRNKLSKELLRGFSIFREFETSIKFPIEFRELKIFHPEVVEKALSDYRQNEAPGEYTDRDSYFDALADWGDLICYILYEIELMIAKEKGITETGFSEMLETRFFRYRDEAERLLEHYPENIGNLTVCPSLWDVNDGWDEKQIVERERKLIEYFNKRWPSVEDCLDAMIQSAKCELIGTDEGIKELSQIVVHDTHIEGIDRNDNHRVVLDKNSIFFTCAAAAWSRLKPYIQEDAELKDLALGPIQLSDEILSTNEEVVAITRSGHVLREKVQDFNEDAIRMKINGQNVIVFKQGLYEFETMKQFEVQVSNFVQDPQNEQYGILEFSEKPDSWDQERLTELFGEDPKKVGVHISQVANKDFHWLQPGRKIKFNIAQTEKGLYARNITFGGVFYKSLQAEERNVIRTYEGTRELSQIVVYDNHIEGIDCNDNQRVALDKSSILFVCPATDWSTLQPYIQENAAVKKRPLKPIQASTEKFQVNDWILKSARLGYSGVVAVTRLGHVLRGEIESVDEDFIDMRISWEWVDINVIVFKQSLYEFETMKQFEAQVSNFIQDPQNEGDGIIEFSSIALVERRSRRRRGRRRESTIESLDELPQRIHVHISQVPNEDFRLLQPGQKLVFNIAQTGKRLYARNISLRGGFYEMIQAEEPNLIRTYEGTRELSQIVVYDNHIEGIDPNDNRKVALDKSSILFVCPATDWSTLKPYIREDAEVKARALEPIQASTEELQVNDWILESVARLKLPDIVAVTRSGHVLRGRVESVDEDFIDMRISWEWVTINVIVFKQGLYQLKTMDRFEIQVSNFVQDSQNESDGIIEFSSIALVERWTRFIELGELPARIYVHISQVPNEDFRLLQPGQKIAFNIAQRESGLYARNITLLGPKVVEMSFRQRRRRRGRIRRRS